MAARSRTPSAVLGILFVVAAGAGAERTGARTTDSSSIAYLAAKVTTYDQRPTAQRW